MTRRTNSARGAGFTLIELLVVIAIIGVLIGLLVPAINMVRREARKSATQTQITQVHTSVDNFKSKFNMSYIPCCRIVPDTSAGNAGKFIALPFRLRQQYADSDYELIYLKQLFPYMPYRVGPTTNGPQYDPNGTGLPDLDLNPNQTLTFFLTGWTGGPSAGFHGFSMNKARPFTPITAGANEDRIGPFLDVKQNNFVLDSSNRASLVDFYGNPYAYFSFDPMVAGYPTGLLFTNASGTYNGVSYTLNNTTVRPFMQGGKAMNMKGYQIISPGNNGGETKAGKPQGFGSGGNYNPGQGEYNDTTNSNGGDDISNFHAGYLGANDN